MCSMSMWADDGIEWDITSSNVEFLEGESLNIEREGTNAKTSKDKRESARASVMVDNILTTPDLPNLEHKGDSDIDMNDSDIMSVLDQIMDKELTFSHSPPAPVPASSTSKAVK